MLKKLRTMDIKVVTLIAELLILLIIVVCRLAVASVERDEALKQRDISEPTTLADVIVVTPTVPPTEEPQNDTDAEYLARVLYGVKDYELSTTAKKAIIDVIFNRVDVPYGQFGDTIQEVCSMPSQFQGFQEDGYFLEKDYNTAQERLAGNYKMRSVPNDCYWFRVERGKVIARNNYDESKATTIITIG